MDPKIEKELQRIFLKREESVDRDYGGCGGRVCAIGKPSNGSLQLRCNLEAALHSLQATFPSTLSPPLDFIDQIAISLLLGFSFNMLLFILIQPHTTDR